MGIRLGKKAGAGGVALAVAAAFFIAQGAEARAGHHGHHDPDESALGLRWYDLTSEAVAASGQPEQVTQNRIWAVSWIAAARAVNDHGDRAYRTAAFATALHDTLAELAPSQSAELDGELARTLASVPDGRAKSKGIASGHREAARSLAERSGDGLETAAEVDPPYAPPAAGPGWWQPTPPAFAPAIRAGIPDARSFLLHSNDEFRAPPPPGLDSKRYLRSLTEVHALGGATGSARTAEQTEVANFIAQPSIAFYAQVLRAAIADAHRSLAWQTRLVAAFNAIEIDQQIAIYDAKYKYVRWRPVTAIRSGAVNPDPSWTPLIATPAHPSTRAVTPATPGRRRCSSASSSATGPSARSRRRAQPPRGSRAPTPAGPRSRRRPSTVGCGRACTSASPMRSPRRSARTSHDTTCDASTGSDSNRGRRDRPFGDACAPEGRSGGGHV